MIRNNRKFYSVKKTKEASEEKLLDLLRGRLDQMISQGTTTIEAKSGYGLELETEIKMLKVYFQVRIVSSSDKFEFFVGKVKGMW